MLPEFQNFYNVIWKYRQLSINKILYFQYNIEFRIFIFIYLILLSIIIGKYVEEENLLR